MDEDIFSDRNLFYDDNFLDSLTKDYDWSSLLDVGDAPPSEILAGAAPVLVPPISPPSSNKSSNNEFSHSDSGSDDEFRNISSNSSSSFTTTDLDADAPRTLKLEDVEEFLKKDESTHNIVSYKEVLSKNRNSTPGPVVSIENGVIMIEGMAVKRETEDSDNIHNNLVAAHSNIANGDLQNAFFKVVNENSSEKVNNEPYLMNSRSKPNILKKCPPLVYPKPVNTVLLNNQNGITIMPPIGISPLLQPLSPNEGRISPPKNVTMISNPLVHTNWKANVPTAVPTNNTPNSPTYDTTQLSDSEIRALKKQQRMIKNRESALQSRQKKKDYVSALEHQLIEAHQEIANLRLENKMLRDQLESCGVRSHKIPRLDHTLLIPKKNIAVLFAMVFMVSMNFNFLSWNNRPSPMQATPHTNARHLLWAEDNSSSEEITVYDNYANCSFNPYECQNSSLSNDIVSTNETENLRIAGDLNRWIEGGKTLNWTTNRHSRNRRKLQTDDAKIDGALLETYRLFNKLNIDSSLLDYQTPSRNPAKNLRYKSRLRRMKRNRDLDFPESLDYNTVYPKPIGKGMDSFGMDFGEWNALFQALHRRDDTFYVVGVGRGEHLLLPAVSHNVTHPPKMALILPAKSGNDSFLSEHVTLMQIDCSVVNTTLVQLKPEMLPESLRKSSEKATTDININTRSKKIPENDRPIEIKYQNHDNEAIQHQGNMSLLPENQSNKTNLNSKISLG